jgi:ubiquitin carboxyl-terminal hydrolase 47
MPTANVHTVILLTTLFEFWCSVISFGNQPFGSTKVLTSVAEGIQSQLAVETLDGDNQYICEKCQDKRDIDKGLRYKKFPYLLTIQLKRFDFDYTTFARIKLNNRVPFAFVLDMNPYKAKEAGAQAAGDEQEQEGNGAAATGSGDETVGGAQEGVTGAGAGDGLLPSRTPSTAACLLMDDSPTALRKLVEERGPHIYELFSVLVHSGSAMGGHYYAYIKDLTVNQGMQDESKDDDTGGAGGGEGASAGAGASSGTGQTKSWYCFNDSSVTAVSVDTVKQAFGSEGDGTGTHKALRAAGGARA